MREYLNRSHEKWALIRSSNSAPNTRLAVFVHGFLGGYLSTWGRIPELLMERADSDPDFEGWDFLFLGYSTRDVRSYLDIANLICTSLRSATHGEAPHQAAYDRLALFGHSLGTLGIRQFLCATSTHGDQLLEKLHSITLFGTPLNGSPLASIGALFYPIAHALKPRNPQLRMLRVWSEGFFDGHARPWPEAKVVLGQGDWVVGHELAELIEWPGDGQPDETVLNHSELSKPRAWTNCAVMDFLRNGLR